MSNEQAYRAEVSSARRMRPPKKDHIMIGGMLISVASIVSGVLVVFNIAFDVKTVIKKMPVVEKKTEITEEKVQTIDKRLIKIEVEHPNMVEDIQEIKTDVKQLIRMNGRGRRTEEPQ